MGFEVGARSNEGATLRWSADYFFGQNYDDLLFVASQQTGFGYFLNFGKTRRDGIELELAKDWRRWSAGGNYTFLNATYQSAQTVDGRSNSTNESAVAGQPGLDDTIDIVPGNYIPQVPRNTLKVFGEYKPTSKLTVELDVLAVGSSFARGNENNLDQPDGVYYLGKGRSAGYGVANMGLRYQVAQRVQLFVQMNNLLDKHYATGAQLGVTPFDNNNHFAARPFGTPYGSADGDIPVRSSTFLAPGAPFNIYRWAEDSALEEVGISGPYVSWMTDGEVTPTVSRARDVDDSGGGERDDVARKLPEKDVPIYYRMIHRSMHGNGSYSTG